MMPTNHKVTPTSIIVNSNPRNSSEATYLCRGAAADIWRVSSPASNSQRIRKELRIVDPMYCQEKTEAIATDFMFHTDPWPSFVQAYHDQVAAWSLINHRNVVRLFGPSDAWSFDVEYCENGCVRDYLKLYPNADKLSMMRDVLGGMKHLHTLASPIVHGSLNAGKLFVSRDGTTKIGEFGLAALCHPVAALVPSVNLAGLSRWLSPELIDFGDGDVAKPTKASDVWALGCTLFEIVTEKLPYSRHRHDVKIQQQILGGNPPGCRDNTTGLSYLDFVWPLMESCWLPLPSDRPTVPMLVKLFDETFADIRAGRAANQPPAKSPDPPLTGPSVHRSLLKPQPGQAPKFKRIRHALNLLQPD